MAEPILIKQGAVEDKWQKEPLTWRGVELDGKRSATVCCGNGHVAYLDHEIAQDGTVTPSLQCPVEVPQVCGWHEMIKLDGWDGD